MGGGEQQFAAEAFAANRLALLGPLKKDFRGIGSSARLTGIEFAIQDIIRFLSSIAPYTLIGCIELGFLPGIHPPCWAAFAMAPPNIIEFAIRY